MTVATAAGVILVSGVTYIAVRNIVTNQEVTEGVAEFVTSTVDTVKEIGSRILQSRKDPSKIDNKKAGKGNKVPKDQQAVEPTGKKANCGVEDIGDPSDIGGKNFNTPKGPLGFAVMFAALLSNRCKEQYEQNAEIEEINNVVPEEPIRDVTEPLDMSSYNPETENKDVERNVD